MDAVIFAVPHDEFKTIQLTEIKSMFKSEDYELVPYMDEIAAASENKNKIIGNVLIDIKGMFNRKEAESMGYLYWRL
jgi:UDP-N-acetyl-D-galactosamine dehydrogenase